MADDNKISFDLELNEGSINSNFGLIDKRAEKSAKSSAAVFGEFFQKQEQDLKESIERLNKASSKAAAKSAEESAQVFRKQFEKQDAIYKASVKQGLDNALDALTGGNRVKKSAQESAAAFEAAFKKIEIPQIIPDAKAAKLSLTDIAAGYFLVTQAIDKVAAAGKAALDFVLRGEAEIKLEQRFRSLAEQANITADVIEGKLTKAARGLLEDDELFQLGSSAFIRIGENAEKLPEVLEAARKSYKVFGGEVTSNAEAIITATETGNKRALRSVGLYTDLDKAVKDYAQRLGTVPALLTEQQTQQARLNAILETADTRFKNVSAEANTISDQYKRAGVSIKEFVDELAKASAQSSGGFFKSLFSGTAEFFDRIKDTTIVSTQANNISELRKQVEILNKRNEELRESTRNLDKDSFLYGATVQGNTLAIQKNDMALESLKKRQEELRELQRVQGVNASPAAGGGDEKKDAEQTAEFIRRRTELVNKVKELEAQRTQAEVASAQERFNVLQNESNFNFNAVQSQAALDTLTDLQNKQRNEAFLVEKANLEKFYNENGINDAALRAQGREALESSHEAKLIQIKKNAEDQKLKIQKKSNDIALQGTQQALGNLASLQQSSVKELAEVGKAAALAQATIDGYVAVQGAFKVGNTIGGPLLGGAFAAAAAAAAAVNIAKIAAVGGGGGGSSFSAGGGSSGSGGGFDSPSSPITDFVPADDVNPQGPQTSVAVTVQGNVLDNRETGLYIAEVLREQFDNGLVVTTG